MQSCNLENTMVLTRHWPILMSMSILTAKPKEPLQQGENLSLPMDLHEVDVPFCWSLADKIGPQANQN